jgi:hypothetical protein
MEKTPRETKLRFISAYNTKNFKCLKIISIYTIWDGLSLKTISRYCPFKWIVHMWNIFGRMYLSILPWDLSSYSLPYSSRIHSNLFARGSQRDVVYLGCPIATSYMSPNAGRGWDCGVSANEYSCAHRIQINFGDLNRYLSYSFCEFHRKRKLYKLTDDWEMPVK